MHRTYNNFMRMFPRWCLRAGRSAMLMLGLIAGAARAQSDGAQRWNFTTLSTSQAGAILSSPAVAADGTVYIGVEVGSSGSATSSGRLFALTPAGGQKWVFPTGDWVDSTPVVAADGTVYFGSWDGNLYALRPDGSLKWSYRAGTFLSASAALGSDGTIYFGGGNGNFYALNPDGTLKWIFPTLYWIDSAPAVAPDGTIYVGSLDNTLYALSPDGTEKWHYTTGNDVISSPALAADGTIYVGSRDLKLYAFTPAGNVKWTFQTNDTIEASPVLGADGTIYVPTTGGRIIAVRPDGTERWRYPAAGATALNALYSTPAVRTDGSLVFGSSNNALYALRADGTLLWRSPLGDWADSSPVVSPDGSIYVGCQDKRVYAFASSFAASMTDWPQLLRDSQRTGRQPLGAAPGTTGRLINLAVRTTAGTNGDPLIVGFVAAGAGARSLLVRGVGPTLASFGVTGSLPNPRLNLYAGSTLLGGNDDWGQAANATAISATAATVGAFALPAGSLDAALLSSFNSGAYTVHVSGANADPGIALMEIYDAGGAATSRLINVSALSGVGTGAGILIAGFVVGQNTRAILIRGVGPALAAFGVPGTLVNPQLKLFQGSQIVAENDDWSGATNAGALAATAQAVGAFSLGNSTRDAVLLVTLPPGAYTAQISGVNNGTGVALIEVYEVP